MTSTIHCAGCQHAYVATALFCPNCGRPRQHDAGGDPLIGKVLGERFLVQELLGQGGSGTIYRAEHVTLRRRVAIKVLHTELSRDDLAIERFRREATTVAEIDNEHIVEIHDFGRTPDGRLYLAMELLEGETLDTVLARERQLSVERSADILIQVGEALMEAHAIGYVHRDLRPRNLYLAVRRGKANFVKLLDFGLAKLVETEGQAASTSLGMTFGDPRYMSPEQARGDRIDRRADIYQLGCVAYEMLTGAPPFTGNRVFDILTKQVTEVPQPLPTRRPGVPLWMEAAVAKMLAKDPENRFATTTRMVEALRRGLETGEVMEDDVARRRESIPPPSVSRVMQRMGMQPAGEPGRADGLTAPAPAVVQPPAAAAPAAPPPVRTGIPAGDPGVTMKAPIAPPPAKPDSVELLRKRTGTPRIGVPISPDPSIVVPAQLPVALPPMTGAPPAQAAPASQPPVAGVIDPVGGLAPRPTSGAGADPTPHHLASLDPSPPAPTDAAASRSGRVGGLSGPLAVPAVVVQDAARPEARPDAVRPPTAPDDGQARGKRQRPTSAELAISQVWYDEGDRLSAGDDAAARTTRARKTISPSATDLAYDDEPPRRRWGLIAGLGAFAVVGGIMAIALARGGSQSEPPAAPRAEPVAAAAPVAEPPPSTTAVSEPPASEVVAGAAGSAARPAPAAGARATPPAAASGTPTPAPRRPEPRATDLRAGASPPARRGEPAIAIPALGSEPTRKPPSLDALATRAATQPTTQPRALTDLPKDPYGNDEPPADGVAPEKKAEFFANLGGQQLIAGDTASAAASFKKALELDGKSIAAMMGMGEIALRQGLFGDAIAHLSRATKLSPRNAKALTLLGEAYLNSGNSAQAATQFKKALQLDPDNARARDGYNEASSRVPPPDEDAP